MKYLKAAFFIFILISCTQVKEKITEDYADGKIRKVILDNNLGAINIRLPNHLDTLFKWEEPCDVPNCFTIDYRFQSKKKPIYKDGGNQIPVPDSIEQLTVKHLKYTNNPFPSDTSAKGLKKLKESLASHCYDIREEKKLLDTVITINNLKYAVIAARGYTKNYVFNRFFKYPVYQESLIALVEYKGNYLSFYFEYQNRKHYSPNQDFIPNSLKSLKTVKLSGG